MLEPLILGMDFLASIGTTLRCGVRRRPGECETIRHNQSEPQPRPRPRRPLRPNTPSTEPRPGIANHDIGPQNDRDVNAPEEPHRVHETHNAAKRKENDDSNNTGGNIRISTENDEARIAKSNDREHQEDHNQEKQAENSRGIPDKDTETQEYQIINQEYMERGCETIPQVQAFLSKQLTQFEGMVGVANIAEHRITMRDDRPIKQRYSQRTLPCSGS